MKAIIEAEGLVKTYGSVRALDGLDLQVEEGSVVGLLGPNGAGKTTAVRVLSTLVPPDGGRATVAGYDVVRRPDRVRRLIGLSGQFAAVDGYLTGRENLVLFARLHRNRRRTAEARADALLERFGLQDAAGRLAKTYSGGMRRRLDLAASLIASPRLIVLDEPTTGLDPRSRLATWETVAELVRDGTSVLLTTQYLEEADRLADRIVVVEHGRSIAEGTPEELKAKVGGERLVVTVRDSADLDAAAAVLRGCCEGQPVVEHQARTVAVTVDDGPRRLSEAAAEIARTRLDVAGVGLRGATLDDVFLTLTGRAAEDETAEAEAEPAASSASEGRAA